MLYCPNCNKSVVLKSSDTTLLQCSCGKVLAVNGWGNLTKSSFHSAATDNAGFIRTGTTGTCNKNNFIVIGRAFVYNEDSVYNYWQILFDDKTTAVLSEGYGHYAILEKIDPAPDIHLHVLSGLTPGLKTIFCNEKKYRLVRKKEYDGFEVEGEMNWPDITYGIKSYELFNEGGTSIEVIDFGKGNAAFYNAEFFLPQELNLSVTGNRPQEVKVTCVKCGVQHMIAAFPATFSFNCLQCSTTHTYNRISKRFEKSGESKQVPFPYIEIGSIGTLAGIEFKVIGMACKQERNADAAIWSEYTLYNPVQGIAYLSEFQGNWVYVKEWPRPPLITEKGTDYFIENGNEFEIFNDYSYKVLAAAGEHIYDLDKTGNIKVVEFICPPQTLIQEMSNTEETWFFGEHLDRQVLQKDFVMPAGMPEKHGIGSVEPAGRINKTHFFLTLFAGLALICVLHFLFSATKEEKILLNEKVSFPEGRFSVSGVTPHFNLTKSESNLQLMFNTTLSNSWLEAEGSFVNSKTGKEYPFNKVVEFYEGFSEGERWTEGNINDDKVVTGIPPGEYYLEYKMVQDSSAAGLTVFNTPPAGGQPFNIKAVYDVPVHSNMLIAGGLVLLVGIIIYARFYFIDKKRWYNSKYSKYSYSDE